MGHAEIVRVAGHRDAAYQRELEILAFPGPIRRVGRWLSRIGLKLVFYTYFGMKQYGIENMPKEGPILIAVNHASNLDPLVLGASDIRYPKVMAKEELFKIPIAGRWLALIGGFPVKRGLADKHALVFAIDLLKLGMPFALFPEGTRSPDGKIREANPGMSMIACAIEGVPILPVRIDGSFECYPKGASFPRPGKITITIGKPFRVADLPDLPQEKKALYRLLADETMKAIANARP